MKNYILIAALAISMPAGFTQAESPAVNKLLQDYADRGAVTADTERGKRMWEETFNSDGEFPERSCTSCHTHDLTKTGKHVKTNKEIKPMTPSANTKRLTDGKKIEKCYRQWGAGHQVTCNRYLCIFLTRQLRAAASLGDADPISSKQL